MEINQERTDVLCETIEIKIVEEDYQKKLNEQLKDYQKKAQIPGFRPGKVPFGMVKNLYGKAVLLDTLNNLASEALIGHIKEKELQTIGEPIINNDKSSNLEDANQKEFTFAFEIGIKPEINTSFIKDIEITDYEIEPDQEDIDNQLDQLRMRYGKVDKPDVIGENDLVYGHLSEKNPGEGKEAIDRKTSVSLEKINDEKLKAKFVGAKKDEIISLDPKALSDNKVDLASMLNIKVEELDSISSDFEFKIEEITRFNKADLDEEFFKQMSSPENPIDSEDQLKEEIKKGLSSQMQGDTDQYFFRELQNKILEKTDFEMPTNYLKKWLNQINMRSEKPTEYSLEDQIKAIKWQLIENKIVEENNLEIDDKAVDEYLNDKITSYFKAQNPDDKDLEEKVNMTISAYKGKKEEIDNIKSNLSQVKLTNTLKDLVNLQKKKVSTKEFIKIISEKNKKTIEKDEKSK